MRANHIKTKHTILLLKPYTNKETKCTPTINATLSQ